MLRDWNPRRIFWSFRKSRLPIKRDYLVLDVGSGGNPHPRADVLLERFADGKHRHGASMVADRTIVLGDALKMPFKDKAFDYVMAFHVLEHVEDPEKFLLEMMRVSRAGYIETPNALHETLVPYDVHLLEVMESDGVLYIRKKESPRPNSVISDRDLPTCDSGWNRLFFSQPALVHVQYHWVDRIRYEVLNPNTSSSWFHQPKDEWSIDDISTGIEKTDATLRTIGLRLMRRWYAWRRAKNPVKLSDILACPDCHGRLVEGLGRYSCACGMNYSNESIPDFNRPMID